MRYITIDENGKKEKRKIDQKSMNMGIKHENSRHLMARGLTIVLLACLLKTLWQAGHDVPTCMLGSILPFRKTAEQVQSRSSWAAGSRDLRRDHRCSVRKPANEQSAKGDSFASWNSWTSCTYYCEIFFRFCKSSFYTARHSRRFNSWQHFKLNGHGRESCISYLIFSY